MGFWTCLVVYSGKESACQCRTVYGALEKYSNLEQNESLWAGNSKSTIPLKIFHITKQK